MEPEELTRRLWLLRLGGGAVLTGLSGVDLDGRRAGGIAGGSLSAFHRSSGARFEASGSGETPSAPVFFTARSTGRSAGWLARCLGEDPATPPVPESRRGSTCWCTTRPRSGKPRDRSRRSTGRWRTHLRRDAVHELEAFDAQQVCRAGLARMERTPHGRSNRGRRTAIRLSTG